MVFTDNSYSNKKIKSHHGQVMWVFFTLNGSFRLRGAVFLAKVGRPVAMPSTSRTLPISEKFCKAQGHFLLAQDTKQNQNFIRNSLAKATP